MDLPNLSMKNISILFFPLHRWIKLSIRHLHNCAQGSGARTQSQVWLIPASVPSITIQRGRSPQHRQNLTTATSEHQLCPPSHCPSTLSLSPLLQSLHLSTADPLQAIGSITQSPLWFTPRANPKCGSQPALGTTEWDKGVCSGHLDGSLSFSLSLLEGTHPLLERVQRGWLWGTKQICGNGAPHQPGLSSTFCVFLSPSLVSVEPKVPWAWTLLHTPQVTLPPTLLHALCVSRNWNSFFQYENNHETLRGNKTNSVNAEVMNDR